MSQAGQVWYWQIDETVYPYFCDYCQQFGVTVSGFKLIDGSYYMIQTDQNIETYGQLLSDWDDEDDDTGPWTFISHFWTYSQVPPVLLP